MLLELLEIMIAKSEKVLIFTQYVEMAKILSTIIEKVMLIEPLMLDGSMSKNARQKAVDTFEQSKEHPIFILSLKAGGVGLNLKAASNVIHYDLWFNPAVENQATDRAFRIGQDKNVFVYRFITKNSFEEKIDNMIKAKLAIGEMSISVGEKNISQMSNDEIKSLFLY
jgi:SNF2 family DNA or RNA helicase